MPTKKQNSNQRQKILLKCVFKIMPTKKQNSNQRQKILL